MKQFSKQESYQMYNTFKMFLISRKLRIYDYPKPKLSVDGKLNHSPLINELLELQATSIGNNAYEIAAPNVPGKHDDVSDSLARAIYVASNYLSDNPGIMDHRSIERSHIVSPMTYEMYHRKRAMLHGNAGLPLSSIRRFKKIR